MISILLVVGFLLALVILVGLGIGIYVIMQSGQSDAVSAARQEWIDERSEEAQED